MGLAAKNFFHIIIHRRYTFSLNFFFRLKKKLDENWFEGELWGKVGMFPVDYVEVVVPLP